MISFHNVCKTYRPPLRPVVNAVEDFTLEVRPGEVLGIAGPNGAGKSTLLSMLLGYTKPTSGIIRIDGMESRQFIERHGIGYLSELVAIPPRWGVEETLLRFGTLAGVRQP